MNHYIKIANHYFQEVEGLHLYPGRRYWLLWVFVIIGFCLLFALSVWLIFIANKNGPYACLNIMIFTVAIPWFLVLLRIQTLRQQNLIQYVNETYSQTFHTVSECHISLLQYHLKVGQDEFLSIAKEIKEMRELNQQFRSASDLDSKFYLRKLYDPDSKQRVLAGLLAMVTLISALIVRSLPDATFFTLLEQSVWDFVMLLMFASAMVFIAFVGLHAFLLVLHDLIVNSIFKLFGKKWIGEMPLNYLVRHLVQYHVTRRIQSTKVS